MSKTLKLTIKKDAFDAILAGDKKTETREIRPNTAHRYIEYIDKNTGKIYLPGNEIPEGADLDARPLEYDAIRFDIRGKDGGGTMVVKVEKAEIFIIQDESGNDITYEENGKKYVVAQIDYTLGPIIESNV